MKFDGSGKKQGRTDGSAGGASSVTAIDQKVMTDEEVEQFKSTSFQDVLSLLSQRIASQTQSGEGSTSGLSAEKLENMEDAIHKLDDRYGDLGGYFAANDIPIQRQVSAREITTALETLTADKGSSEMSEISGSSDQGLESSWNADNAGFSLQANNMPTNASSCASMGYEIAPQPDVIKKVPSCLTALRNDNAMKAQDKDLCERLSGLTLEEATKDVTSVEACEGPQKFMCSFQIGADKVQGYTEGQCNQLNQSFQSYNNKNRKP